jgi:hypothetical protein
MMALDTQTKHPSSRRAISTSVVDAKPDNAKMPRTIAANPAIG